MTNDLTRKNNLLSRAIAKQARLDRALRSAQDKATNELNTSAEPLAVEFRAKVDALKAGIEQKFSAQHRDVIQQKMAIDARITKLRTQLASMGVAAAGVTPAEPPVEDTPEDEKFDMALESEVVPPELIVVSDAAKDA